MRKCALKDLTQNAIIMDAANLEARKIYYVVFLEDEYDREEDLEAVAIDVLAGRQSIES